MKILVIQLYQTGDVVLTSHIPREIKKIRPESTVDFLTFGVNAPLLEHSPYIDKVIKINKKDSFLKFVSSIIAVRKQKYDAVIDLHDNPRSAYITFFSGASMRIGYDTTSRKFFYNTLAKRLKGSAGEIKLSLLQPLAGDFNVDDFYTKPEIHLSEESHKTALEVLDNFDISEDDFIVTMSPTHKRDTRRWKFEHFMETASYLIKEHNAKVIITYGPGELEYITERSDKIPEGTFLMPEMKLADFAALIGKAKLHIGNDSAPHHIATAQNVPTFIIIGSTTSGWVYDSPEHTFYALGLDCQPCKNSKCKFEGYPKCMEDLTFDKIKDRLEKFIKDVVK
jgi:ADP-heptose:LPS heptosyltransferase